MKKEETPAKRQKPKDKGETRNCVGILSDLVEEYDVLDAGYAQRGCCRVDAKCMVIDFGENQAEKRKGECNTADIGTKAVTAEILRRRDVEGGM